MLTKAGIAARGVALYDSMPAQPSPEFIAGMAELDAVLLHSPKASKVLAKLLRKHPAPHLRAFCLSPAVARPLSRIDLAERVAAPIPFEAALLNLIDRKP